MSAARYAARYAQNFRISPSRERGLAEGEEGLCAAGFSQLSRMRKPLARSMGYGGTGCVFS